AYRRPRVPPPATPLPPLADAAAAVAWLDAELPTLVAVAGHAASVGWPTHSVRLAATLQRYFAAGHHTEALAIYTHARLAAHGAGDPDGEAEALNGLGFIVGQFGRREDALDHHRRALALY